MYTYMHIHLWGWGRAYCSSPRCDARRTSDDERRPRTMTSAAPRTMGARASSRICIHDHKITCSFFGNRMIKGDQPITTLHAGSLVRGRGSRGSNYMFY